MFVSRVWGFMSVKSDRFLSPHRHSRRRSTQCLQRGRRAKWLMQRLWSRFPGFNANVSGSLWVMLVVNCSLCPCLSPWYADERMMMVLVVTGIPLYEQVGENP